MQYSTESLPQLVFEGCDKGNFATKNARFREAVCKHFKLQWVSVAGTGNCFFESICILLRAASIQETARLTARELRGNVVEFFRACSDSTQDLCERVVIEINAELNEKLVCSTHARNNGMRVNGFAPCTIAEYLDAVAIDGVWVQGWHWLRAISFLYAVRVAVVIYGHEVVRFFGEGEGPPIYLYKVDAETHWDALAPLSDVPSLVDGAGFGAAAADPELVSDKDYAYFVHSLFVNCAQSLGARRRFVQNFLRCQFNCTCKSWIALSPDEREVLYDKAINALRTYMKFRDDSVRDLTEEIEKSRDAAATAKLQDDLQFLLDPICSSEEELCDIPSSCSHSPASRRAATAGGGGGAGECTLTLKRSVLVTPCTGTLAAD